MKLAVLVFGEYREFETAVKSWKFLNEFDCDVYVSTWDKSEQHNDELGIHITEDVTENKIRKHLPNSIISIKNESEIDELNGNIQKMFYHWKEVYNLMKSSNVNYDYVMLYRIDLFFDESNFKTLNRENTIYCNDVLSYYRVPKKHLITDNFFYGSYLNMCELIENVEIKTSELMPHRHIYKIIKKLNLNVETLKFRTMIVRPNIRKMEVNIDTVFECFYNWKPTYPSIKQNKII